MHRRIVNVPDLERKIFISLPEHEHTHIFTASYLKKSPDLASLLSKTIWGKLSVFPSSSNPIILNELENILIRNK